MAYVTRKTLKRARELRQNLTQAEAILWSRLRKLPTAHFRRQHPVGPYIADFACARARLIVEIDGATHGTEAERERDARRDRYLRSHGWQVLRIANPDIYRQSDDVVAMICETALLRLQERTRKVA